MNTPAPPPPSIPTHKAERTRDAHGPVALDLDGELRGRHALHLLEGAVLEVQVVDGGGLGDDLVPPELGPVGGEEEILLLLVLGWWWGDGGGEGRVGVWWRREEREARRSVL